MLKPFAEGARLAVAVLGSGRLGETHVAALAHLRDAGQPVEPALYGRDPAKVSAVGGHESVRSLVHLRELFRLAQQAGILVDPERSAERMRCALSLAGIG